MKKLFRPLLVLACLAVLSVAAFAAVSPVLEKQVEDLVRNAILANNCTVKEVKFNSSGTLVLTDLATTISGGGSKSSFSISEVGVDIPLAFMPVLVQPDAMLPKSGTVEVASRVTLRNFVHTSTVVIQDNKPMTSSSKTSTVNLEKLRVDAAALGKLLAGDQDPATAVSFIYGIEVDSLEANDTTGDIPEEKTFYKVAKSTAKGLKKAGYEEASASGIQIVEAGNNIIDLGTISARGVKLPPEATVQALVALLDKNGDPTDMLLQMLADPEPLVQEFRIDRIDAKDKGSKAGSIDSIVYLAGDNWKRRFAINGLVVPSTLLNGVGDWGAFLAGKDEFRLDALYLQHSEDNDLKLLTSFNSPDLGDVSLNGTYVGDFGKAIVELVKNPMIGLGYKFKDLKLVIEDRSLLARLLAALGVKPEMAPATVEGLLMQVFENPGEETSKLVQAIRDFANKPGTLEVFTKPGMEMVAAGFIAVAANPGAVLSARATQGNQNLVDQMRALPVAGTPGTGK